jgi:S-adenosylmethionine decarboxylase
LSFCPDILRQRLIVEGLYGVAEIDDATVRELLAGLSAHLGMTPIADTLVFSPDTVSDLHHGIGGYQAWAESGCAFYTWRDRRLFTLDIYSCRGFDVENCLAFVRRELQSKEFDWRPA